MGFGSNLIPPALRRKPALPPPATPYVGYPTSFAGFVQEAGDPGTTGHTVPQEIIDQVAARQNVSAQQAAEFQARQSYLYSVVQGGWAKAAVLRERIQAQANQLKKSPAYAKHFYKGLEAANKDSNEDIDKRLRGSEPDANSQLVGNFQKQFGLPVTGVYDPDTQAAFRGASRLSAFGAKSAEKGQPNRYEDLAAYTKSPLQFTEAQTRKAAAARQDIFNVVQQLRNGSKGTTTDIQQTTDVQTQKLLLAGGTQSRERIAALQAAQGKREGAIDTNILREVLGITSPKDRGAAIAKLLEASGADDFTVIQIANNLKAQTAAAQGKRKGAAGEFLGGALETIFEPLQRAYYAGQLARNRGLGIGGEARAFVGGLPGLGFTAGDGAERKAIEDTNSYEERAKLTEKGQLASFGEVVSGRAFEPGHLRGAALKNAAGGVNFGLGVVKGPKWVQKVESPALDVAFQVFTDPTFAPGIALHAIGKPFELVAKLAAEDAARAAAKQGVEGALRETGQRLFVRDALTQLLDNTAVGTALQNTIDITLEGSVRHDLASVKQAFRGLPNEVAGRVALADTKAEAKGILREALLDGSWRPEIRPTEQARLGLGLGSETVGRKTIRQTERLAPLRDFARGGETRAASFTRDSSKIAVTAIDASLHLADPGIPKFRGDFVARVIDKSRPLTDRVTQLFDASASSSNSGLKAYVEQRLAPLLKDGATDGVPGLATARSQMFGAVQAAGEDLVPVVDELETVVAILEGKAGKRAAAQMELELSEGFIAGRSNFDILAANARSNVGTKLAVKKGRATGEKFTRSDVEKLVAQLPENLRGRAGEALDGAKNAKDLRKLGGSLKDALANKRVLSEMERIATIEEDRLAGQLGGDLARGLGPDGLLRKGARNLLGIVEEGEPAQVPFKGGVSRSAQVNERVNGIDRLAAAFELTDAQRSALRNEAKNARTPEELFKVVEKPLRIAARDANLDPKIVESLVDSVKSRYQRSLAFGVDQETGDLIDGVQTAAQRIDVLSTPDPRELYAAINEELAKNGDLAKKIRINLSSVGDLTIFGFERGGKPWTLKLAAQDAHRLWKLLIVTNLHLPLIGALAGVVSVIGGGDPEDIATGAAIGLVGPTRYIWRVAGVEEKFRTILERGFKPTEWIPVVSKWRAEHGIPPGLRFADYSSIRSGANFGSEFETRFFLNPSSDWKVLEAGDKGFNDAWMRTVQFQLQPGEWSIDNIMLGQRAGRITKEQADRLLAELKTSDEGKLWLANMKGGTNGPKTWKQAVANQQRFVDTYAANPEIAEARLSLAKGDDLPLALFNKSPDMPKFVHAQAAGKVKVSNLWRNYQDVTSRFVLSSATNVMNRAPLARWVYADNYDYLTRVMKMEPERAAEQASEIAVAKTNEVMFRIDSESRFARKIDYVFPFQQPREEFLRVWTKLVANNPMRSVRVVRAAALALNNGEKAGIFKEDPYTGEWVMTVPGSGALSKALGGLNAKFNVNLRDMFFVGNAMGASGIPTLGGPYWSVISRQLVNEFPEFFSEKGLIQKWLMPYGPGSDLFRPESRRLWAGITGSPAPWSFLDEPRMEGEFERGKIEVARSLYAHNVAQGMSPDDAWPTDEQVKNATKDFFKMWSLMGSITPATPRPVFPEQEQFQRVRDAVTLNGVIPFNRSTFLKDYPEYAPYLTSTSEWTGPDDFNLWKNPLDVQTEFSVRYRETVSFDEFKSDFVKMRKEQQAYDERGRLFSMPAGSERETALMKWAQEHPDLSARSLETYHRDRDLGRILAIYPQGEAKDAALNRWRTQYNVSSTSLPYMMNRAKTFIPNPWRESRDTPHIMADVERKVRRGTNEAVAVSRLSPAEQYRYWDQKQNDLNTNWSAFSDPKAVMDEYNRFGKMKRGVLGANPLLTVQYTAGGNRFEQYVESVRGKHTEATSALTTEIQSVTAAMDAAAKGKRWSEYYALKDKQQTLYDMKRAVMNDLYERFPDLSDMYDTMAAQALAVKANNVVKFQQLQTQLEKDKRTAGAKFMPTSEEAYYLSLPDNVKKSYVQTIVDRLNAPALPKAAGKQSDDFFAELGAYKGYIGSKNISKFYWNMLSDFQQDLLSKNLPADQVRQWSVEGFLSLQQLRAKTHTVGGEMFDGNPELQWAYSVMQQYDKRGGVTAPKDMEEYLSLPADPMLRANWLADHPNVQGYLEATGYMDIPDADRALVQHILMKYAPTQSGGGNSSYTPFKRRGGRFYGGGGGRSMDVQFAFEQLRIWNRRPAGASAPDTYNLWLNMPSGREKAAYLEAHPEIGNWLKLGPMSNMPDAYKDVIRDIMHRYGLWSQQDNPLGDTITAYYATPSYARNKFLQDHPELLAYWSALRSPDEQAIYSLTDQYFTIQDPTARRAFLAAHPEVQTHMVESRNKRYERFLNQVAIYMGENPELFDHYLARQTEVLNELLRRYAEPPLAREVFRSPTGPTPGGRVRTR